MYDEKEYVDEEVDFEQCWLIHPDDDDDCLQCPDMHICRQTRQNNEG